MIVSKVDGDIAEVVITDNEARVLHDALTIAKLQVGEALLLGPNDAGIVVDHLRRVLASIYAPRD